MIFINQNLIKKIMFIYNSKIIIKNSYEYYYFLFQNIFYILFLENYINKTSTAIMIISQ